MTPTPPVPEVSVVVGVYNGERYVRRSLESVLAQQGVALELIVIDDGSTDGTGAIIEDLAACDARVRYVRQPNRGLTQALVLGCSMAVGEFIARHDADDLSLAGRLAKQLSLLRAFPEVSFVSCWMTAFGPENEVLFETRRPADPRVATELLRNHRQGPSAHGTVVFRRAAYEKVGGYRHQFYFAQDSDLWLRLSEIGRIAYVPEVLYAYRVSTSAISTRHRALQHALGELGHRCREARQHGVPEHPLLTEAAILRPTLETSRHTDGTDGNYFIGRCLLKRRDPRARKYLSRVIRTRPWSVGAWAGVCQTLLFASGRSA